MWKKLIAWFEVLGTARAASQLANMGYLAEAKELMVQNAKAKQTIKELSALTDKELQDIGIARGEIRSVAYGYSDNQRAA
jgi:uncharacterized protein YjiS (DUF1127 family)